MNEWSWMGGRSREEGGRGSRLGRDRSNIKEHACVSLLHLLVLLRGSSKRSCMYSFHFCFHSKDEKSYFLVEDTNISGNGS